MLKHCCDCCGKSHYDIRLDKRLKEKFNIKAYVCLDCSAWMDDVGRYEMMLDNGIINDKMFDALVVE